MRAAGFAAAAGVCAAALGAGFVDADFVLTTGFEALSGVAWAAEDVPAKATRPATAATVTQVKVFCLTCGGILPDNS